MMQLIGIDFHTTSDGTMHEVDCGCPLLQARVPCGYLTSKGLDGSIALSHPPSFSQMFKITWIANVIPSSK